MKKIDSYAIVIDHVSKEYIIHHEKPTLVEKFFKGRDEKFLALGDINLKVKKGESIGIIGDNGSGKTTLLKLIAGITTQTSGTINVTGKVISLIDLDAGFHSDLSGFQNIYLNGMFLGMTKKEIDKKLKAIIRFAGIRQFIDAPFFTYSQGMKLRLGFSVAIYSNPDVLLIDENFAVGDAKFGKKSGNAIKKFRKQGKTILFASHWKDFVRKNSERVITLKEGRIIGNLRAR
jgi:ABC-type polysaccharide/polyol phosphate transport system ATPase subunit